MKFSLIKAPQKIVLIGTQYAYIWHYHQHQAVTTIRLPEISDYFDKQIGAEIDTIYWVLANEGYRIVPQKYRLGSRLLISDETLSLIDDCCHRASKGRQKNSPKKHLFAVEQLLEQLNKKGLYKIAFSDHLDRYVTPRLLGKKSWGIQQSRLSTKVKERLNHLTADINTIDFTDMCQTIEKIIQEDRMWVWQKAIWSLSIGRLIWAEVFLFCLLCLLSPAVFWLLHQTQLPHQPLTFHPNQSPVILTGNAQPSSWQFAQLSAHLRNLRQIIHPLKSPIIQNIDFVTPRITLSGYWQEESSKLAMQQQWQSLLRALKNSQQVRALKVLRHPLQGDLSQRRFFRLQLHLNPL